MFTLAPLNASHRDALQRLLHAAGTFSAEETGVGISVFDDVFAGKTAFATADYEFTGAFDARGTLVGYACFGPTPVAQGTFDLYWIAVDPEYQGQGVGSALLTDVTRQLAARGARLLVAETSSRSPYAVARRFYETHGFGEGARLRDFYAPGDARVVFTRYFRSPPSLAPQGAQPL